MGEPVIDNAKTLIDAGKAIAGLQSAGKVQRAVDGGYPYIVNNAGEAKGVEAFLLAPVAKRAVVTLHTAAAFIGYVNRFKDSGSVVFADLGNRKFEAVLDYHAASAQDESGGGARWGKHRVAFEAETTTEWDEWTSSHGVKMNQVDFARFIEDRIPNIGEPAGADLLEMCLKFEAKKDAAFKSFVRLADGQHQLTYEEVITGSTGAQNGSMKIPNSFTVVIEPFQGVGQKAVEARFRYRINQGTLALWYELVRPDDVLEAAFDAIVADITTNVSPAPVLAGVAPVIS